MRAIKILLLSASVLCLWSCAEKRNEDRATATSEQLRRAKTEAQNDYNRGSAQQQGGRLAATGFVSDAGGRSALGQGEEPSLPSADHKIIRNATLIIETDDPAAAQRKVGLIAETNGGFVVTSEFKTGTTQRSDITVNVILRIPASLFEATLAAVRSTGGKVVEENVSGKDVTEEYVDLEARLRAKKALEAQFLEIMKQARKVSDALEVQSNIANVRTEIEQIEGRRKYLENQASLATITVTFRTPAPVVTATTTGFGHSVKEAFGEGADTAVAIVLGLIRIVIVMIPIVVLILLPIAWTGRYLVRYLLRKYHQPKQPEPVASA